jgi:fructokinase
VLGEVLWDVFEGSRQLGGAALNFAAHAKHLGHESFLISAVGVDSPGEEAAAAIAALGLDATFLQRTTLFQTGTARVELGPDDRTRFVIERPAAYDAVCISDREIEQLIQRAPAWFYYGTLFPSTAEGEAVLQRLLGALPMATRLYDLNLRPGWHSASLVKQLLAQANVVKLNEEELQAVHEFTGLPINVEAFCREGARRFGWKAVCVTLGARGCALLACGEYVEAAGQAIDVIDTVGAGDAFTAAFMHGLICHWPVASVAAFANRVGAVVASRHGAIPDWTIKEAVEL